MENWQVAQKDTPAASLLQMLRNTELCLEDDLERRLKRPYPECMHSIVYLSLGEERIDKRRKGK